jgi:hypothetical protein
VNVPLFNPAFAGTPVASVNGEYITLEQLQSAIALMYQEKQEQKSPSRHKYAEVLNRLLNVRLMVQEANNIGLDQTAEIKSLVDEYEKTLLKQLLFNHVLKEVKADAKEVEQIYRAESKEWRIKSIFFKNEADAKKIEQEWRAGKNFDAQLEKLTKDGSAKARLEPVYMSATKLQPLILQALEKLKAGAVSPVIALNPGFTVVQFDEIRVREDAQLKEQAQDEVLKRAKQKAALDYRKGLKQKYVKMRPAFFKKLDFEAAKPGLKKMLDDKRVVAEIKGEKPVTVADLAVAIQEKFFHGYELAIKEKKVNVLKDELLDQIMMKKLYSKEIALMGIDKSDEFRKMMKEYRDTTSFGIFIEKVIRPEVKVTEEQAKAYYREHVKDYSFPEMVKFTGLAFTTQEAAQGCLTKLRQGADLKWLKETAEGQVKADDSRLMNLNGNLLTTANMPAELRKALAGAKADEVRLYAEPDGYFYALQIQQLMPSREMPFNDAKQTIIESLYEKNTQKTIEDWAKKLREASDVKVYVLLGEGN